MTKLEYNEKQIKFMLRSTKREGIEELILRMEKDGFFTSPCSGANHLAVPGGLAEHSLNVFYAMASIKSALYSTRKAPEKNYTVDTLVIVSLLHDLGKMGDFGKPNYVENTLKSGKQSDSKPYKTNPDLLYIPHEVRSVSIASEYIRLTEEEYHAIYYHNGKYTHTGYDLTETPLQMILHLADLWASREMEVTADNVE